MHSLINIEICSLYFLDYYAFRLHSRQAVNKQDVIGLETLMSLSKQPEIFTREPNEPYSKARFKNTRSAHKRLRTYAYCTVQCTSWLRDVIQPVRLSLLSG